MHEPNCSSLPGQQCVSSAVGVASHGCRAGDGAKSTKIRGKGVGQTLALPPTHPEPGPEPGPGPHPGPGWTAQRPCYHGREEGVHLYVQGGWNTVTPRLKAGGGRYPTAVSP